MSHTLVEIPRSQWPQLRDLYTKQKRSASAYNTLQCLIEWKDRGEASLDLRIYSLDGQWQEDGTYVAIKELPLTHVFCNTLSENKERLRAALSCINVKVARNKNILYFGFPENLMETIRQSCFDSGLTEEDIQTNGTYWYYIEQEKAKQFVIDVPAGYALRRLDTHHAEQVNNIWPHRAPGSELFVRRMITYSDSVGVFDEATNQLVAWCLRLPIGSLGLLQVMQTHQRLGFGCLVVRYMSKLLAEKDIEVTAPVVFENVASRNMFEKLGFRVIDKTYWIVKPRQH